MINIQDDIFKAVKTAVTAVFPSASITNDAMNTPKTYPHVTVVESDNYTYTPMRTDNVDNYVHLIYDINVYSDKQNGRKAECDSIFSVINDTMTGFNFTRLLARPVPNAEDNRIYRITARYRAICDKEFMIYQH